MDSTYRCSLYLPEGAVKTAVTSLAGQILKDTPVLSMPTRVGVPLKEGLVGDGTTLIVAWKTFGTLAIQRKLPVAPAEVDR